MAELEEHPGASIDLKAEVAELLSELETAYSDQQRLADDREEARGLLRRLLDLKDGPRDSSYYVENAKAWGAVRAFLSKSAPEPQGPGYLECEVYRRHGACSCSTGIPGNKCPLAAPEPHECSCQRHPLGARLTTFGCPVHHPAPEPHEEEGT